MLADVPPNMPVVVGDNISLTVMSKSIEDLKFYFEKMKDGGTIIMDLQETFWTKCYGSLKDKFGITWQFSLEDQIKE
jgi:PhnB protein